MSITAFVIVVFGILPIWAVIVVAVWWGLSRLIQQVGIRDLGNLIAILILVSIAVVTVMAAICYTCRNIMPTEAFASTDTDNLPELAKQVAEVEVDVCSLVERADKYIESNMGAEGQDNPAALAEQLRRRRADAGGVLDCKKGPPPSMTPPSAKYIAQHISQMEQTLTRFTLPVFQESFKAVFACEIEAGAASSDIELPPLNIHRDTLSERLARIQEIIRLQRTHYLDAMDRKEADARAGRVSECDMQRGSNAAVDSSNQMMDAGNLKA